MTDFYCRYIPIEGEEEEEESEAEMEVEGPFKGRQLVKKIVYVYSKPSSKRQFKEPIPQVQPSPTSSKVPELQQAPASPQASQQQ